VNNDYDSLFDSWGNALNVDPQLVKSVFHAESGGQLNSNPMGIMPDTMPSIAKSMGFDPKSVDVSNMGWAVPIATRVLANGLNATQSPDGAVGYYNTGSTDPAKWNQQYIGNVTKLYPTMALKLPQQQPGNDGAQPAPDGSAIASTAGSLIGNDASSINPFLRANGQTLDATRANWCAAFVNGVLQANGVQGTTGLSQNVATSFSKWGDPVPGDPQAGDVLVQSRGHPAGGLGGHVGIATGQIADGPSGSFYLMESGNLGGKVSYSWEPSSSVVARRAPPPPQAPPPAQQTASQ
jgi:hypothetical protein